MNNIYSISRNAQAYFSENFLRALTAQEKKVALVAVAIFAAAVSLYYLARSMNALIESSVSLKTDLGDGRFKKVFKDGTIEIGTFKGEKLDGEGQRLFPDELIDETEDLEGMEPYPKGYSDIRAQEGTFEEGVLSGKGQILFWDGRVYEGTFANGVLVEGTKDYSAAKDSKLEYEKGKFVDDKLDARGETRVKSMLKFVINQIVAEVLNEKDDAFKKLAAEELFDTVKEIEKTNDIDLESKFKFAANKIIDKVLNEKDLFEKDSAELIDEFKEYEKIKNLDLGSRVKYAIDKIKDTVLNEKDVFEKLVAELFSS